jgi:hypothetical protein
MTAVAITQSLDDIGEAIAKALDHIPLEPAAYGERLTFESA